MGEVIPTAMRKVFQAPTAGRWFLTRKAAALAEARARIRTKYPTESYDRETGDSGWHWTEDERLCRVYERLGRRIYRQSLERKET
jgi:hypothetical protein